MVAPLIAAGLKYALGQGLERAGLPAGLSDPKGYALGQLKSGVDSALGVMPGTTNAVTDPKGALIGAAKNKLKEAVQDAYNPDDSPMSAVDMGGSPNSVGEYAGMKRGGKVKSKSSYQSTSKASSASRRGDGIAQRGKTKGRML